MVNNRKILIKPGNIGYCIKFAKFNKRISLVEISRTELTFYVPSSYQIESWSVKNLVHIFPDSIDISPELS